MISATSQISDTTPFASRLASDSDELIAELISSRAPESQPAPCEDYQRQFVNVLLASDSATGEDLVNQAYDAGYGPEEIRERLLGPALEQILGSLAFPQPTQSVEDVAT